MLNVSPSFTIDPSDNFFFVERCFYFSSQEIHSYLLRIIFWKFVHLRASACDRTAMSQYRSWLFISLFNTSYLWNLRSTQCVTSKTFFWGLNTTVRQLKFKCTIYSRFLLIYLVTAFRRKLKNQDIYCFDTKEYFE